MQEEKNRIRKDSKDWMIPIGQNGRKEIMKRVSEPAVVRKVQRMEKT